MTITIAPGDFTDADGNVLGTVKSIEIHHPAPTAGDPLPATECTVELEVAAEPSPAEMSPAAYRRKFGHHKPTNLAVGIALALRT